MPESPPCSKKRRLVEGNLVDDDKTQNDCRQKKTGINEVGVKNARPKESRLEEVECSGSTVSNDDKAADEREHGTADEDVIDGTSGSLADVVEVEEEARPAREEDVGILLYLSDPERRPIKGIIKQRYSDFLVNEIALDGSEVHLTDQKVPEEPQGLEAPDLKEFLSAEEILEIEKFADGIKLLDKMTIQAPACKESRGKLHKSLKVAFPQLIFNTETCEGKKVIKISAPGAEKQRNYWPVSRGGDFCTFVLHKHHYDTMTACATIAARLRRQSNIFTHAGNKDRRAISSQRVSAYRVSAGQVSSAVAGIRDIHVGNFSYTPKPVRLGDNGGNFFRVVMRDVDADDGLVASAVDELATRGFINYFGTQRFGTTEVLTHHIGREVLKSNWNEVVELILKPRKFNRESQPMAEARQVWMKTRNAQKALDKLRFGQLRSVEGALLKGLAVNPDNPVAALGRVAKNSRLLYGHAYQSFVWNSVASRRISAFGVALRAGDLVLKDADSEPQVLSEDSLKDFDIFDLVLPLPGHAVMLPQNASGQWYSELLARDGMTMANFKNSVKDYNLPGGYRRLLSRPTQLGYSMVRYDHPDDKLVLCDIDLLTQRDDRAVRDSGKYRAMILNFGLRTSSYATMLLRELLRSDTSSHFQTALTVHAGLPSQ